MRQIPALITESAATWKDRLLFQNDACMVINKLPGESSESIFPSEEIPTGKLPVPVHRLDMPVSGCLLFARNPEVAAFLGDAFARHDERVVKRYWAIIEKPPPDSTLPSSGELVHWLSENRKANKSFASESPLSPKGRRAKLKKAVLRYRLTGEGDRYLFMEIDLVTGRHHQIRSQLAALGLHIKGDLKYGARRSEKTGGIRLHAHSLDFPNPLDSGETITVKALPPVMDSLWTAFSGSIG
jgi:23S rRNA pseudouridine1911/1915/1917 synthase